MDLPPHFFNPRSIDGAVSSKPEAVVSSATRVDETRKATARTKQLII